MKMILEQTPVWRDLDNPSKIHDRDAVTDLINHVQIVRDEEVGQPHFPAKPHQKIQNLRLHRNVQRGNALVAYNKLRMQRKRSGNTDSLLLPAGKLVRISAQMVRCEPDRINQLSDFLINLFPVPDSVDQIRFRQNLADRPPRIQAGRRVLKDNLDLSAHFFHLRRRQRGKVPAVRNYLAAG